VYEAVRATQIAADNAPRLAATVADAGLLLADRHKAAAEHHFINAVVGRPGSAFAFSMWGADERSKRNAAQGLSAYSVDSRSYGGGVDVQIAPGLRVGLVASRTEADATTIGNVGAFRGASNAAALLASWTQGPLRAELQAGRAWQDFAIVRQSGLSVAPEARAKTDGTVSFADARLHWSVPVGRLRLKPRMGLRYAQLKLDGWQEEGARFTNVAVEAQKRDTLIGRIGAAASVRVPLARIALRPFASGDYSHELLGGEWDVRTRLGSGQRLGDEANAGERSWVDLRAGAAVELTEALSLTAAYETRMLSQGDERRSYNLGLNFRF
jgi:outer membrane autotransporter protein